MRYATDRVLHYCFHYMAFLIIGLCLIFTHAYTKQTVTINVRPLHSHLTLESEQQTFTENVCKLLEFIVRKGYHATLGECYRTHDQAVLYARKGLGIVNSLHCERLAIDLNIFDANEKLLTTVEEYRPFGEYWESLHARNVWGGRWTHRPDADHFEMEDEK